MQESRGLRATEYGLYAGVVIRGEESEQIELLNIRRDPRRICAQPPGYLREALLP